MAKCDSTARDECDLCGEKDDDSGNVVFGRCPTCTALCCGNCQPAGNRTECVNCADDAEPAFPPPPRSK